MILNEGDGFSCLCRSDGGKYPVNITWYEDKRMIGGTHYGENILSVIDVNSEDNKKTYRCVVQRYSFKDEKYVDVFVYRKYITDMHG